MAEQIKMNFDMMEDMAQAFSQGARALSEVTKEVVSIAAMLDDGTLVGAAGERLSEGLRGPLARSIGRLEDKFQELVGDLHQAMAEMRQAEASAKGLYH
jgi:uncharacterized protein YukE